MLPNISQPPQPEVRVLCHRSRDIQVEHRLGRPRPQFRNQAPERIPERMCVLTIRPGLATCVYSEVLHIAGMMAFRDSPARASCLHESNESWREFSSAII